MRIVLDQVSKGRGEDALRPTTVTFESGSATLARAETQQRPTVLGLLASGRMTPGTGVVTVDGVADPARMRREIALVDAPLVSDPAPNVSTLGIVEEELMFSGGRATAGGARERLETLGLARWARTPIANVDPTDRVRLLLELAAARPEVSGIVLVSPDRHGGDPQGWWDAALDLAGRGLAVLVIAGDASVALIGGTRLSETPDQLVATPEETR